jgi:hypothetical protein
MITFKLEDFRNCSSYEAQNRVMGVLSAFSEWCKHVISEERRVSEGPTGLVVHKYESIDGVTYWFSIDSSLWR